MKYIAGRKRWCPTEGCGETARFQGGMDDVIGWS